MKELLILGAGTGGVVAANMMSHKLILKEWRITIVDRASTHIYQPGLLFIPFRLYGYDSADDVSRRIESPIPRNVRFVTGNVMSIDKENKKVEVDSDTYQYDWLISAMGCHIAPEEIDGMPEFMGNGVHTFYELNGAIQMQKALDDMQSGRLVIDIAEMPIKCPVAPIEFAFLADYFFQQKGVREKIDITLVTPFNGAFTKPNANRVLSEIADAKGIEIVSNFSLERVDGDKKTIHSFEGQSVDYDLLCAIPPNLGPEVLDDSELGDGSGYGHTDPRTLKSRKADFIYFLGDNSNVGTSKAGSVAHFEAETVVANVLREMDGKPALASFDGHANCFIESGHQKALLIDFNYDMEPLQGDFPLPYVGPFSLLEESHINHMGKIAFKWIYWNMLLPGHLPNVPLLPSHMSFVGKDLQTTPQIRNATRVNVGDIMQSAVKTVQQGSALSEAAKLMTRERISGLPVVDMDNKLVGILTEADFLSALDINGSAAIQDLFDTVIRKRRVRKQMGTIVDDIMTWNPVCVSTEDPLQRALELMNKNQIKRLVITDDENCVCGVVSRADLMRLYTMQ
ncbi:MAG: NAD(P)/FAD-dependent oxidoreductase [Gammaproteobacteria bacterium]|nr:MAG: NAD(P)/FAD-dependent oxidoreductase [Gammaproteobacteria bacterium]